MPSMFENAVASIRMGVEDFRQQDADRDISAVRNLYSGILLLAKETIIRSSPGADPALLIAANSKPFPDGKGGVIQKQIGKKTIDYQQLSDRAKDFGVKLNPKALEDLNKIRNDMEHHYTSEHSGAIRAAISKSFTVAASLFRQIGENPVELLGDNWNAMLETKELYDQELKEARETLLKVKWFSPSIAAAEFKCEECHSELIEQIDSDNCNQNSVNFHCITCGDYPDLARMIEFTVDKIYGSDAYSRHKDMLESGPIHECPACNKDTLIEHELVCANCNETIDYEDECSRCSSGISLEDYLQGYDAGLCSYCSYVYDKMMRED